jgi:hypothetical protein
VIFNSIISSCALFSWFVNWFIVLDIGAISSSLARNSSWCCSDSDHDWSTVSFSCCRVLSNTDWSDAILVWKLAFSMVAFPTSVRNCWFFSQSDDIVFCNVVISDFSLGFMSPIRLLIVSHVFFIC